jgi:cytoskeletal protein RodZ
LGAYLQQLRQKQRISLETVAKKTLIPVRLLAALEIGNTKQLPEPVYIQGFIVVMRMRSVLMEPSWRMRFQLRQI